MLPSKVILKATGKFQPGIAIALSFGMARKNAFHYTAFLGENGAAEIGREELLRAFNEDRKLFIMDYGEPNSDFAGDITGHILTTDEIERRIEGYAKFSKNYQFPSKYLDNLNKALTANVGCGPTCTVSIRQVQDSYTEVTITGNPNSVKKPTKSEPRNIPFPFQAAKGSWASSIIVFFLFTFSSLAAEVPLELIAFLLIIIGFGLGVAALCGIRKHGWKGILIPSLIGLILNGFLLFIFGTNFSAARAAYHQH